MRLRPNLGKTRLLLVPRHPERFDAVADLAARAGFMVKRRSEDNKKATGAEIMVLDTIGELATAYRFATVAFVGGTLIPHGGQSILEPAWYAKPIVIGPSMENFRQIARDFRDRGAVIQIQAIESDKEAQIKELTDAFVWLLEDEERRTAMGRPPIRFWKITGGRLGSRWTKLRPFTKRPARRRRSNEFSGAYQRM